MMSVVYACYYNVQVKYADPTDVFMRRMNFPFNGRYLTEKWEEPFCEEALRLGVRLDRDKTPMRKQSAKRFAALEVLKEEGESIRKGLVPFVRMHDARVRYVDMHKCIRLHSWKMVYKPENNSGSASNLPEVNVHAC